MIAQQRQDTPETQPPADRHLRVTRRSGDEELRGLIVHREAIGDGDPSVRVQELLNGDVFAAAEDVPVAQLVEIVVEQRVGAVPVVDDHQRPVGVVSSSDLLRLVSRGLFDKEHRGGGGFDPALPPDGPLVARDVMSRHLATVPISATLAEALRVLNDRGVHQLLAVDAQGGLVGIFGAREIARAGYMMPTAREGET